MRKLLLAVLCVLLPFASQSQTVGSAVLIANEVSFSRDSGELTARGNVEIAHGGTTLRASSVSYNGVSDQLTVTGPIYLEDASGTAVFADFAQLDGDLQAGVLTSARLVFNQRLQLAANEIRRSEGRYTQLYKTTVSSCKICAGDPTPLWEIRAKRVVHDSEERQLHFENATLRVFDVPVAYVPRLRLPDPTVKRASGFLVPEFRTNDILGFGIETPYFFTLGDHADITLTPWLTTNGSETLQSRYRQKLSFGEFNINAAITDDNLTDRSVRGYLFADGRFDLPRNFTALVDIEVTSDPGYLLLYGFSEKDRLDSAINIFRTKRDKFIGTEFINFESLRDGDENRNLPTIVGDGTYRQRFDNPRFVGGFADVELGLSTQVRRANTDPTNTGLARDVTRFSAVTDWQRDWILSNGMLLSSQANLRADVYAVNDDDRLEFGDTTELTPALGASWSWPMYRESSRTRHLIEPMAQFIVSPKSDRDVVNEDSVVVEFDEANLFSFSRFPGVDAQEQGARLNLGVSYTREAPTGWSLGLTVGRVFRQDDAGLFSASTGLQGTSSDWLIATQYKIGDKLNLINRSIVDDVFGIARNETLARYKDEKLTLTGGYSWLEADVTEERPLDTSEFNLDGSYRVARHVSLLGDIRYDFLEDRATRAGLGIQYKNECATVDLSVSRRFTTSDSVEATTDVSLSVQLGGFGASNDNDASFTRQCNG